MDILVIVLLCVAAFLAGFIDAIVGGGGLIQTPMGIILLPNLPVSTIIGTLKIPSFKIRRDDEFFEKNSESQRIIISAFFDTCK